MLLLLHTVFSVLSINTLWCIYKKNSPLVLVSENVIYVVLVSFVLYLLFLVICVIWLTLCGLFTL